MPAPLPYPHIILINPGGTPALSIALANTEAVASGVNSAVLTTVELPAANEQDQLGDTTTLADPSVVESLIENRKNT